MIFVNFKTYPLATGENAVKLAIACETVYEKTKVPIIPIVQALDVWRIHEHVHIPIWIQHIDQFESGTHTGYTVFDSVLSAGAAGTILNHSEHPITMEEIGDTVSRIRKLSPDFPIMICAPNLAVLKNLKAFSPQFIAYEPPELIGSKTASVATAHPEIIEDSVRLSDGVPIIVGAGIKTKIDVEICRNKNVKGVLVSSGVVLSENPAQVLSDFAEIFASSQPPLEPTTS